MLSPNGIRAILFDLDGTLRYSRPSYNQAFFEFARKLGLEDTPEKRQKAMRWLHYYWAQSAELLADLQTFGDRQDLFWTNHARLDLLAYQCSEGESNRLAPEIYRLMSSEYNPQDWVPADVPGTLKALRECGFTLGVVSNRTHPYLQQLQALGLADYFELALAAGEINSWKPEPAIFQHALEKLNEEASHTLYVGDNYYADVLGAQGAGLQPVLLDPEVIFPEAECAVIQSLADLPFILEK